MLVPLVLNDCAGGSAEHRMTAERVAGNRAHRRAGKRAAMRCGCGGRCWRRRGCRGIWTRRDVSARRVGGCLVAATTNSTCAGPDQHESCDDSCSVPHAH